MICCQKGKNCANIVKFDTFSQKELSKFCNTILEIMIAALNRL